MVKSKLKLLFGIYNNCIHMNNFPTVFFFFFLSLNLVLNWNKYAAFYLQLLSFVCSHILNSKYNTICIVYIIGKYSSRDGDYNNDDKNIYSNINNNNKELNRNHLKKGHKTKLENEVMRTKNQKWKNNKKHWKLKIEIDSTLITTTTRM